MTNEARQTPRENHAALLIIDMINRFDFDDADALLTRARDAVDVILRLRQVADDLDVPTIYVNDNYGEWTSDRDALINHCLDQGGEGAALVRRIRPRPQDLFIIKPQVSGFYATNLAVVLPQLGVTRLVLTGVATDICVLFTAADAHMRAYDLWVPEDASASSKAAHSRWALEIMVKSMKAVTRPTREQSFEDWLNTASGCEQKTGASQAERT